MTVRLGISVNRVQLGAVLVRGTRVVWHSRTPLRESDGMGAAIARLLASAPIGRLRKPHVAVVIGLAQSQVRQIEGLPRAQVAVLTRIVRENVDSFFLRFAANVVVTDLQRRSDDTVWAAAFDGAVVSDALSSLKRRGFRSVIVVPHATVSLDVPRALLPLGDDANELVAAYAGAVTSEKSAFVWRAGPSVAQERRAGRTRIVITASGLLVAVVGALVAPGIRAIGLSRAATRELSNTHRTQIEGAQIASELQRVSAQLDRVERFRAARGGITLLLGELSQSLPDSTALVSFRADTAEVTFVALTPHAADILPQLIAVRDVVAPRIAGSITRETQGSVRLERATIRFRRPLRAGRGQ